MSRINILFLHQNSPGQLCRIAAYLASQPGNRVIAVGKKNAPGLEALPRK